MFFYLINAFCGSGSGALAVLAKRVANIEEFLLATTARSRGKKFATLPTADDDDFVVSDDDNDIEML